MLPLVDEILPLEEIAEYWSRELRRVRTMEEIHNELLSAFWQNKLIVYRASGGHSVDPRALLKPIRIRTEHPGFRIIETKDQLPPRATKNPDGSVDIDPTCYIVLPSDENSWTADILKSAYGRPATRSFEDFDDLVRPGLRALSTTREALGAYCDSVPYQRPRFWFDDTRTRPTTKSGGRSFGGRPSVMRRIEAEMKRRAERGELAPRLREEAQALRGWAERHIEETSQIPQERAIENGVRELYNQLKSADSAGAHKT
jgi:hypothetical protein